MSERYKLARRGPLHNYSEKRLKNAARRIACRMAHDGFAEKFLAVGPGDPEVIAECHRILRELAQRGRIDQG